MSEYLNTDMLCLEFIEFRNNNEEPHLKTFKTKIEKLEMVKCALLGLFPERGIPLLPCKLAKDFEEWDKHLTFEKKKGPEKRELKTIESIENLIDEQYKKMDLFHKETIDQISAKSKRKRTHEEIYILDVHEKLLDLEKRIREG